MGGDYDVDDDDDDDEGVVSMKVAKVWERPHGILWSACCTVHTQTKTCIKERKES